MLQSDLFGRNQRAAAQIFDERNAFLSRERGNFDGSWGIDEAAHEEIASMNFQNQRGLFANDAAVIGESCFVGGANFAQLRTARFQEFANSKAAADLNQLAPRNDGFRAWPL